MMDDGLLGRHISLQPSYENFDGSSNIQVQIQVQIQAQVVDLYDTVICDAILDFAKREGVTDIYLLDKEFVKTALINEAKRRKFGEVKELKNWDKEFTIESVDVIRCKDCKHLMTETACEETPYGFENEYKCYGCKRLFDLTNEWVDVMLGDFCSYGKEGEDVESS